MDKYKILSHTADLRLEIYGKTKEELFENAATAIAEILVPRSKTTNTSESTKEHLKLQSLNISTLLVDFLNDILAKSNINKAVYKVKSLKLNGISLIAELEGVKVEEFNEDIKAVTYHEAEVEEEGGLWKAKLVLDI